MKTEAIALVGLPPGKTAVFFITEAVFFRG